jgi:MinD superfamily P-loop ATPase
VADLAAHFKVAGLVCINKFDLNTDMSSKIEDMCEKRRMATVGRIPFDPVFTKAMIEGKNIFEYAPDSKAAHTTREVWESVMGFPAMNMLGIRDFSTIIR